MTENLSPYGVAIHEAAHSVIATMFNAPWHAVSARERHGKLIPDKDAWRELLEADPDGNWPQQVFAMVSLAGPIAEARWNLHLGHLNRRIGSWFDSLEHRFGGEVDIPTARMWAREAGVGYETLADDLIKLMRADKISLAIERVADALIARGTLIITDVNQLVYGNLRGAQ
jgi:hypothetical protein